MATFVEVSTPPETDKKEVSKMNRFIFLRRAAAMLESRLSRKPVKKRQDNSERATALHIALALTLTSGLATLVGSIFNAPPANDATTKKTVRLDPGHPPLFARLSPALHRPAQPRQLSVADRIAYQRAIEKVYWRHRIWPKENSAPKPSLDEVMPAAQIEQKVE